MGQHPNGQHGAHYQQPHWSPQPQYATPPNGNGSLNLAMGYVPIGLAFTASAAIAIGGFVVGQYVMKQQTAIEAVQKDVTLVQQSVTKVETDVGEVRKDVSAMRGSLAKALERSPWSAEVRR